jgi:hypothetical protein
VTTSQWRLVLAGAAVFVVVFLSAARAIHLMVTP